jgi:hypothetical protein
VPARNTIFLSFALAYAEVLGASDIFIGVNALDYSGYPDCRPEFISAFETLANLATASAVEGRTKRRDPRPAAADDQEARSSTSAPPSAWTTAAPSAATTRRDDGGSLRALRCLPVAPQGIPRGRHRRPDAVRRRCRPSRH